MSHLPAWIISAVTILLILSRPKKIPEAVWACAGAFLLLVFRSISPSVAVSAAARGVDVYLFLTGMMILAELARHEGFFDWIAVVAVRHSRSSPERLFALVYGVGIVVTAFLSNDATAVVLTPAVFAAVKKARAKPLPYLLICAFIANAASFVLPISNPANLVVYGSKMPRLTTWLQLFGLASVVSIFATYLVLRFLVRRDLAAEMHSDVEAAGLSSAGKLAAWGIVATAVVLLTASALDRDLGLPTLLAALAVAVLVALADRTAPLAIVKDISWSVLPLVAGLFVLVAALDQAGAIQMSRAALSQIAGAGRIAGGLGAAFSVAFLSNLMNNLPVGLIAGNVVHAGKLPEFVKDALLIGIDLGPNLSITGSLATILWLVALRREGEHVSVGQFLRYGFFVMTPALALAVLAFLLANR